MADSVVKVLTFFVVAILFILVLNLIGDHIAANIPGAFWAIGHMLQAIWNALRDIVQSSYWH